MDGNNQSQDVQKRLDELRRKRRELEKKRRRISQGPAPSDDLKSRSEDKKPSVETSPAPPPPEKVTPPKSQKTPEPPKIETPRTEPTVPSVEPQSGGGRGRMIGIIAGACVVVAIVLIILLGGKDDASDLSQTSIETAQSEMSSGETDANDDVVVENVGETIDSIDDPSGIQEDDHTTAQVPDPDFDSASGTASDPLESLNRESASEGIEIPASDEPLNDENVDDAELDPIATEEVEPVPAAPRLVDPEEERLDEPLNPIKRVDPVEYAKEMNLSPSRGLVLLQITIATDGSIEEVVVVRSLDEASDAIAVDAVSQWEFAPPIMNGEPVRVLKRIPVTFR